MSDHSLSETKTYTRRPLRELNLIDDFLFTSMLTEDGIAVPFSKLLLETILQQRFSRIDVVPQRVFNGLDTDLHGIRLDAYIEAVPENDPRLTLFDIEPDNMDSRKQSLPRRNRYYSDVIDATRLESGTHYAALPDLVTIMILSYDPFGQNAMYYEARSTLITHPDVPYQDGIRRIYLYTGGVPDPGLGDYGATLRNMLQYIQQSTEDNVRDDVTSAIDRLVHQVKGRKGVDISYMMMSERIEWQIREACEEASAAASAAARAETLAADAIAHVRSLRRRYHASDEDLTTDLINDFHIDPDQVAEILERASQPEEDLVTT